MALIGNVLCQRRRAAAAAFLSPWPRPSASLRSLFLVFFLRSSWRSPRTCKLWKASTTHDWYDLVPLPAGQTVLPDEAARCGYWFGANAMSASSYELTVMPGSKVSSTIRDLLGCCPTADGV